MLRGYLYDSLELWLYLGTYSWTESKANFLRVLKDFFFFTWSICLRSVDTPDRRVRSDTKVVLPSISLWVYLGKTFMDMLNVTEI